MRLIFCISVQSFFKCNKFCVLNVFVCHTTFQMRGNKVKQSSPNKISVYKHLTRSFNIAKKSKIFLQCFQVELCLTLQRSLSRLFAIFSCLTWFMCTNESAVRITPIHNQERTWDLLQSVGKRGREWHICVMTFVRIKLTFFNIADA